MKKLSTWAVLALLSVSFLAWAGVAFGDCGNSHKPIKKITTTESTPVKTT